MKGDTATQDLLWTMFDNMYNTFIEYNNTALFLFIEANTPEFAVLTYNVAEQWMAQIMRGKRTTKYKCLGLAPFRGKSTQVLNKPVGTVTHTNGVIGEATTYQNKSIKVEALRKTLDTDRFVFHRGFAAIPNTPQEARRILGKLFEQLSQFQVELRNGKLIYSGKLDGKNDDLVLAFMFMASVVLNRSYITNK